MPENEGRQASLLDSAEQLLDRGNLEQAPLLAEILRRQALIHIARRDFGSGEALLSEAAGLLRARFGRGSTQERTVLIELETQRIVLSANLNDRLGLERAVKALEAILQQHERESSSDRGIAIELNSALIEGYEALGRGPLAEERRLELNRLLH